MPLLPLLQLISLTQLCLADISTRDTRLLTLPSQRVVNGVPANYGEVPFIVRLEITGVDGSFFLCGGSLITSQWIITAAHCVTETLRYRGYNHTIPRHGRHIQIVAGDLYRSSSEVTQKRVDVTQVFVHENYVSKYLQNDLALLYVEEGLPIGEFIEVALMGTEQPVEGSTITIAGWGITESGEVSEVLKTATYTVPSQSYCKSVFKTQGLFIFNGMWCTGSSDMEVHTAGGDSGGPVFKTLTNGSNLLYGVVSWGISSDIEEVGIDDFDVNVDVSFYRDWILDVVENCEEYMYELVAEEDTDQLFSWSAEAEFYRYILFTITTEPQLLIIVTIHNLTLSLQYQISSDEIYYDYSHLVVRDGNTFDLLAQLVEKISSADGDSPIFIQSVSNKIEMVIRTTNTWNTKSIDFSFTAVEEGDNITNIGCGGYSMMCEKGNQCYDPLYHCDGEMYDCFDQSDETSIDCSRGLRRSIDIFLFMRILMQILMTVDCGFI